MPGRRNKFDIIYEILKLAAYNPVTKTKVVYGTNLNFKIADKYLSLLKDMSLIEEVSVNGKTFYKSTEKGLEFVRRYEDILESYKPKVL